MKLSVCIISFNEEKNIKYPLDSSYDFADEIVLIDGGSTDKTVEIAKSYGSKVKIYIVDNPKNFLKNKQRAIEKAQGEWIFQLDADEAVSQELKKEIKSIITTSRKSLDTEFFYSQRSPTSSRIPVQKKLVSSVSLQSYNGFWIPRKNLFLNRFLMKGGVYPDSVLRLYKKEGAKFDLNHLHENVVVKGKVGELKNAILHYADPDFSRYLLRWDRYTTFDAEKLFEEGKRVSFCSYFFIKPFVWFIKTYFRHKGFMDGFPGFVFSLFSSIRFWTIYIKYWNLKNKIDIKELF
ncbi:MAG: glycosyltransferase family 2 protein [bacterium]